ncbi:MAG: hypothetical protein ACP6IQ_05320 [Candidatus Njordarchaeia archaeon]|nr:hypothetical protein [Candidatus Korarchaeota archaeon]
MEIEHEEPLMLWDIIKLLKKRKGDADYWDIADQRRTYEYAINKVRLNEDDARELLKELIDNVHIPKIIAVQLVDILPITIDELEPFLQQIELYRDETLPKEERETLTKKLLDILREYWKKAKPLTSIISEEEKEEKEI